MALPLAIQKRFYRFKHFENVKADLESANIENEDFKIYKQLEEVVLEKGKEAEKIEKIAEKAQKRCETADKRIQRIERRKEQISSEGISYIIPFTKKHKEYKTLKKRLKIEKACRKIAEQEKKNSEQKVYQINKKLKDLTKALKKRKKLLKKIWKEHASEIDLVKTYTNNKYVLSEMYNKESFDVLTECVEVMQKDGYLPSELNFSVEKLNKEIKRAKRFSSVKNKKRNLFKKEIKDVQKIQEILEKSREEEKSKDETSDKKEEFSRNMQTRNEFTNSKTSRDIVENMVTKGINGLEDVKTVEQLEGYIAFVADRGETYSFEQFMKEHPEYTLNQIEKNLDETHLTRRKGLAILEQAISGRADVPDVIKQIAKQYQEFEKEMDNLNEQSLQSNKNQQERA